MQLLFKRLVIYNFGEGYSDESKSRSFIVIDNVCSWRLLMLSIKLIFCVKNY